jgi:hypothetical protein
VLPIAPFAHSVATVTYDYMSRCAVVIVVIFIR